MNSALQNPVSEPAATAETAAHHVVFETFERTPPRDDATYHYNFMGTRIAHEFERDLIVHNPGFDHKVADGLKASGRSARYDSDPTYPLRNSEDYFEWVDLLTAIDRAKDKFTMIEIGAGYGRWIANAAGALTRRKSGNPLSMRLIALEADKGRFEMMIRNCQNNGIAKEDVGLYRAACTPDGKPVFMFVNNNYGEGVWYDPRIEAQFAGKPVDILPFTHDNGQKFVIERIPAMRLDSLLTEPVDFIDMDIQGAEITSCPPASMHSTGSSSSFISGRIPARWTKHSQPFSARMAGARAISLLAVSRTRRRTARLHSSTAYRAGTTPDSIEERVTPCPACP